MSCDLTCAPGAPAAPKTPPAPTGRIVLVGLLGLAAAMGVGRFAYTPLLPLMQAEGLPAAASAWLAGANYLGYLLGALASVALRPVPEVAARRGLAAVAVLTLLMAAPWPAPLMLPAWGLLRLAAGMASAFVLVGVSAWALTRLPAGRAAGWVYAGVGIGMAAAGLVAMAVAQAGSQAALGWLLLGVVAAGVWAATRARFAGASSVAAAPSPEPAGTPPWRAGTRWLLIACYGGFGFGYIIPATFLPALARQQAADPAVFCWAWPLFGLAAAVSTPVASRLLARGLAPRRLWALSQLPMALGVLLPVFSTHLAVLALCAVCVGGSFMVVTMAGLQEARRVAGAAGAPRLMAAMTAAFGLGQLLGPLTLGGAPSLETGLVLPSLLAAALLLGGSAALCWRFGDGRLKALQIFPSISRSSE